MPGGNLWIIVLILIVVSRVVAALAEKSQQHKEQQQRRSGVGSSQGQPHQVQTRPSRTPPTQPGPPSRPHPTTMIGQSAATTRGDLAARRRAQLEELRRRRQTRGSGGAQPTVTSRARPGPTATPQPSRRPPMTQPPTRPQPPQPVPQRPSVSARRQQQSVHPESRRFPKLSQIQPSRRQAQAAPKPVSGAAADAFSFSVARQHPIFGGQQPRDAMRRLIVLREVLDAPVALRQGNVSDRVIG